MSVWTLAADGLHGQLFIGQPLDQVIGTFGEPTLRTPNDSIIRFDDVELHFANAALAHACGVRISSATGRSEERAPRTRTRRVPLPLDVAAIRAAAETVGLAVTEGEQWEMTELTIGRTTLLIEELSAFAAWSVT